MGAFFIAISVCFLLFVGSAGGGWGEKFVKG